MPKFIPIQEVVKLPMLANDDVLQREKGKLLSYAKYVYLDMQLDTLKLTKRQLFDINKRTNSITLPDSCLEFNSVSVIDDCGGIHPVYRNDNIHDDIVDVPADKDCACEYKCSYKLCSTIKGYEAVITTQTDTMPNGDPVSFTCVERKAVDANGFFYTQLQYPKRIYTDGTWTDTILFTENKTLCKVDVDDNGCVCDSEQNLDNLCGCLGLPPNIPFGGTSSTPPASHPNASTWIYFCNSKQDWFSFQCGCSDLCCNPFSNRYNISDDGRRLLFPRDFMFGKALVRWYEDISLLNMEVPFVAVETFVMGLKAFDEQFNDAKRKLGLGYGISYAKMKWGLSIQMNRHRMAETRMILTPPVFMPSFLPLWGYGNYPNV